MRKTDRFLIALALAFLTAVSAHGLEAKVVSVSGKAEVQAKGTSSWKALRVGDVISKGSVISTGFKSSLGLNVDGSTVTLGALTRMTLEQLASNDSKTQTSLYLDSGRVHAEVNKTAGKRVDFKVSSPVATASVRGTSFSFSASGNSDIEAGLVAMGPGVDSPTVYAGDDPDGFLPAPGDSNAMTPTSDINGKREVPVYAGQESGIDSLSGKPTDPQREKQASVHFIADGTSSMANREMSMGSNGVASGSRPSVFAVDQRVGTVLITVLLPDN